MESIQDLLNSEANLADCQERQRIHEKLKHLRGSNPPICHGEDDCSSIILCQCPWRIDCGT